MSIRLRVGFLLAFLGMRAGISARPLPQSTGEGGLIFERTGQVVSGEFLDFYQQADDPLILFGDAISGVENHPVLPGVQVQYFQRARMELYPNEPEGKRVRLAPLGVWLYAETQRGEGVNLPFTPGACRLMGSKGFAVCYEFLKFYEEHNGALYFGEPISGLEKLANGRLVQYFERARMEWWPENPAGARVVLTNVGQLDFDRVRRGQVNDQIAPTEFRLVVYAFPARPFVAAGSQQTINVIVRDQGFHPVSGALVRVSVVMPDRQVVNLRLPETDDKGLAKATFEVGSFKPGDLVKVEVTVDVNNAGPVVTSTSFRIWW